MKSITTERLIVRRFAEADLADYLAYRNHPAVLAALQTEAISEEKAIQLLARQASAADDENDFYHSFAVLHRQDGRVIGEVGVYLGAPPENKAEIGFAFHPEYQGQGYASEAAQVLLRYVFEALDRRRITSMCDARNSASFQLMERLGMTREGHLRQSHFADGAWHDEYLYGLLRDEWRG